MGLLVFLGSGLATLLRFGVEAWHTAERRGQVHDAARAVLERLAEDLRSTLTRSRAAGDDPWVRFLCDADASGRQRLRLVRANSGEAADSILREGGRYLAVRTPAAADGHEDAVDAEEGILRAPGGAMEVLYARDPRPGARTLWRGFRSPAGGPDSLFLDANVEEPPGAKPAAPPAAAPATPDAPAPPPPPEIPPAIADVAEPIAGRVLHWELAFWASTTNTWKHVPPKRSPRAGEPSGPTPWWDSTRALLRTEGAADELVWTPRPGSLEDARDDVFPERVLVTVVIGEEEAGLGLRLAEDILPGNRTLQLTGEVQLPEAVEDRFVLVDDEWMEIEAAAGRELALTPKGRGARFTQPAKHDRGARVELGTTFRRVVDIPCYRTEDREAASASGTSARRRLRG
jgi:hypothetical protein